MSTEPKNILPSSMDKMRNLFIKVFRKKSTRYGVPFLLLILGGSFGLKEFTQLRYQFAKHQPITPEDARRLGVEMKKQGEVTLESEFQKIKEMDIDNWSNKRGPRPWEDNK